jgi:hypothetical protein
MSRVNIGGRQRSARIVQAAAEVAQVVSEHSEVVQVPVRCRHMRRLAVFCCAADRPPQLHQVHHGTKARSRLTEEERARAFSLIPALSRVGSWTDEARCVSSLEVDSTPVKEILIMETIVEATAKVCLSICAADSPTDDNFFSSELPLTVAVAVLVAAPLDTFQRTFGFLVEYSLCGNKVMDEHMAKMQVHLRARLEAGGPARGASLNSVELAYLAYRGVLNRRHDELAAVQKLAAAAALLLRECAQCRHGSHVHRCCALCKAVWFCDADCQRAHWRAGHRDACAGRAAVAAAAAAAGGAAPVREA